MKTLFLILSLIFCPLAFGQSCNGTVENVVIGFGYLTNSQGQVFAYTHYPIGSVCIETGITYTEVANQAALPALYVAPPTAAQQQTTLDAQTLQEVIIDQEQSDGTITSDQATAMSAKLTALNTAKSVASALPATTVSH